MLALGAVVFAIASPSGATVTFASSSVTCKAKLRDTREQLDVAQRSADAASAAYSDAVDHIENARPLLRTQILEWRRQGLSWSWIKRSPVWRAFSEQLYGT